MSRITFKAVATVQNPVTANDLFEVSQLLPSTAEVHIYEEGGVTNFAVEQEVPVFDEEPF